MRFLRETERRQGGKGAGAGRGSVSYKKSHIKLIGRRVPLNKELLTAGERVTLTSVACATNKE